MNRPDQFSLQMEAAFHAPFAPGGASSFLISSATGPRIVV
jgi:hypothetical protein